MDISFSVLMGVVATVWIAGMIAAMAFFYSAGKHDDY